MAASSQQSPEAHKQVTRGQRSPTCTSARSSLHREMNLEITVRHFEGVGCWDSVFNRELRTSVCQDLCPPAALYLQSELDNEKCCWLDSPPKEKAQYAEALCWGWGGGAHGLHCSPVDFPLLV